MSTQARRPGCFVGSMGQDSTAIIQLAPRREWLEAGQVLGITKATGRWGPYSPDALDGRNVATGVLWASAPPSMTPRKVLAVVADADLARTELTGLDAAAERQLWEGPRALPIEADPPPACIRVR